MFQKLAWAWEFFGFFWVFLEFFGGGRGHFLFLEFFGIFGGRERGFFLFFEIFRACVPLEHKKLHKSGRGLLCTATLPMLENSFVIFGI